MKSQIKNKLLLYHLRSPHLFMKKLVIVGTNKTGKYIAENPTEFGLRHQIEGFLDIHSKLLSKSFLGFRLLSSIEEIMEMVNISVILAFENSELKKDIRDQLLFHPSIDFPNLISSKSWVSKDFIIGRGNIILGGNIINFGTCVGSFSHIDKGCLIGHGSRIGNFCNLKSGVIFGGHTYLEDHVVIGESTSTYQGIRIGMGSLIKKNSVLRNDVPTLSNV